MPFGKDGERASGEGPGGPNGKDEGGVSPRPRHEKGPLGELSQDPRDTEPLAGQIRIGRGFREAGQRLLARMNRGEPDGPQELYWLTRSVERTVKTLEEMSRRISILEARNNVDDALLKERNARRSRYRKLVDTAVVGGAGWIVRDLLEFLRTLAAHMRHP